MVTISTASPLPLARMGTDYLYLIEAASFTSPLIWNITGGTLRTNSASLTIVNDGGATEFGRITFVPITNGEFTVTVRVDDGAGGSDSKTFDITVLEAPAELGESEILKRIQSGLRSTTIYELLPTYLKTSDYDPSSALKGFFNAVQAEWDRTKQSVDDILLLVDPLGINNQFTYRGPASFLNAEQMLDHSGFGGVEISFSGNQPGVDADDYYNYFGVTVVSTDVAGALGNYRQVIDYDGAALTATVDIDFGGTTSTHGKVALAFPDRVYLPVPIAARRDHPQGTILPDQALVGDPETQVILPATHYISTLDDYYVGFEIEMLDGRARGETAEITGYDGDTQTATVAGKWRNNHYPRTGDWFKLTSPDHARDIDNYYKGHYLRVLSHTSDSTYPLAKIQTRKILRSEYDASSIPAKHVCYVYDAQTGEGERFAKPPGPTAVIGVVQHNVSLTHLARQVGYRVEARDAEELRREQIRQAFSFYKLKGTKQGFETIIRSFGLVPEIEEQASNYVRDYPRIGDFDGYDEFGNIKRITSDVGPGTCQYPHKQSPWPPDTLLRTEGEDIDCDWYLDPDLVNIADSDLRIYVKRINPRQDLGVSVFPRLLSKLEEVRPAHVEIAFLGFLEKMYEDVEVSASLTGTGSGTFPQTISVDDDANWLPSDNPAGVNTETVNISEVLTVSSPGHLDQDFWFDSPDGIPGDSHYDIGHIYFSG